MAHRSLRSLVLVLGLILTAGSAGCIVHTPHRGRRAEPVRARRGHEECHRAGHSGKVVCHPVHHR